MMTRTRAGLALTGIAALVIAAAPASAGSAQPDVVGSYLSGGKLVVAVSDAASAEAVRRTGATPKLVRYTAAQLTGVQRQLDGLARAGRAGKARSWYVDPVSGTVVVKVPKGATDPTTAAFLRTARAHGGMVTVRTAAGTLAKAADLLGGNQVNLSSEFVCSLGFNAKSSSGTRIFFTAGHCTAGAPRFSSSGGWSIGTTRVSRYPVDDWGSVNITNPGWTQRGLVERWTGTDVRVRGWSNAPVGSPLCKSGRTTHWTCGTITARNVSVNYGDGWVSGLYEHTACVEGGDSGGPNMSGQLAQGLTSGAATIGGLCLQKYGQPNESLSQPIGEALTASGASLVLG
jgi:streptogrisin C